MGTVLTITWTASNDLLMRKVVKLASQYSYVIVEHWSAVNNGQYKSINYIKIRTDLGPCGMDIKDFIEDCERALITSEQLRFITD